MNPLFSNQKPYLLEPHVLVDSPLPIFKSIGQLLSENVWELLGLFLIFLLCTLFYFLRKKKSVEAISKKKETAVDPFVPVNIRVAEGNSSETISPNIRDISN